MRRLAIFGTIALLAILALTLNGSSQEMKLHGDAYMSNGTSISGFDNVWVGIHIDGNDNGRYESFELYDTSGSNPASNVTWDGTNGTYTLDLSPGDPNWDNDVPYVIMMNASRWGDDNGTVHQHFSTVSEWMIPGEGTLENEVDIQTRFVGFVINEFLFDDEDTDDDEWIEIFNPTNLTRSIDQWSIHDNDTDTGSNFFQLGNLPDFPSGDYLVIHYTDGQNDTYFGETQTDALHVYTGKESKWNNNEDQVLLFDSYQNIVDFVAYCADGIYDNPEGDDYEAVQAGIWDQGAFVEASTTEGYSIGLEYDGVDNDDYQDWTIFTSPSQGDSNVSGTPIPEFGLTVAMLAVALLLVALARRGRAGRR